MTYSPIVLSNDIFKHSKEIYGGLVQETFVNGALNKNEHTSFVSKEAMQHALDSIRFQNKDFKERLEDLKEDKIDWFDGYFEQYNTSVRGKKLTGGQADVKLVFVKVEKSSNSRIPFAVQTFYPIFFTNHF